MIYKLVLNFKQRFLWHFFETRLTDNTLFNCGPVPLSSHCTQSHIRRLLNECVHSLEEGSMCGNLYFVKEVHIEGGKHFDHNVVVALCTDKF